VVQRNVGNMLIEHPGLHTASLVLRLCLSEKREQSPSRAGSVVYKVRGRWCL
jgi:hypothetical protein